jgi:hypothetical protein
MAAGDAVIGALRVVLGTDTANFEDGLKSASSSLQDFAKHALEVATGIELYKFAEEAANKLIELGKASVETAAQMGRLSQQLGVSTEFISGLTVAARLSDVDVTALARSVGHLDKEMAAAATGGTNAAASAFRYLGISAKELKTLKPEDALNRIADAFQKMPDGMNKTAVASALFGDRVGRQMIPVLNEGSHGLDEMQQKARALGLVFDEQVAKDSERLMQNLRLLGTVVQGVANVVAGVFVKSWADSTSAILEWVIQGDKAAATGRALADVFQFMLDNIHFLQAGFGNIVPLMVRIFGGKEIIDISAFTGEWREMYNTVNESLKGFKAVADALAKGGVFDPESAAKARQYDNAIAGIVIRTRELTTMYNTLPTGFIQAALATGKFKDHLELTALSVDQLAKMFPDLTAKLQDLAVKQVQFEMLTPFQKYEQAIAQLRTDLKGLGADSDEFKFKQQQLAATMQQAYGEMAKAAIGGFAQLFQALGQQSQTMFRVWQALAIAEATVAAYMAYVKVMATSAIYPWPIPQIMGASALAAGLGAVIKIATTKYTGAAQGGSFMVPGGSMGVDTKMVSMALAPGEVIDVTPADQARRGGRRAEEITVKGIRPNDLFTGEMVRGMFDALNRGYSDGYRVKFAT